ncbi:Eukaryotic family of unknown function (DUF1754) [Seminavis robusta]|uniref:Uncharacterized protein n=1 Tax=Seminavis robusta TaxID=568900 RepID=A0A9N8HC83_9STRA|nr:Eukaryotic family of unknown function (DUF1754) [Seminavis robusta]|eukprot:Sro396_g134210.1 Eukaryotic family of unknown function (DUF1754) (208) ;mRNA; f:4884-5507
MARGKLVFKGDDAKKKKKKKAKHSSSKGDETSVSVSTVAAAASVASAPTTTAAVPQMVTGSGKITTSGTVVTGHGTKFGKEIAAGDALIVMENGQQQMRVVTMRLSDISLNLSSAFGTSFKTPTSYKVIRKPRDDAKLKRLQAEQDSLSKKEQEELASGTFGSNEEFVYRVRTETGNYRIKREKTSNSSTRTDMLDMRSKKTSDKYC